MTSAHVENRQKEHLSTENKPHKHEEGSLETSERENANYSVKTCTDPTESRDEKEELTGKAKRAHSNTEIKTLRDSSHYSVNMSQYK